MIQFRKEQIGEVIERLYNSEINAQIDWFWDAGFSFGIGDACNGWSLFNRRESPGSEKQNTHDIAETISAIAYKAQQIYPDSEFSKWYDELVAFQELKQRVIDGELVFYPENASVSTGILSFEVDA